MARAHDSEMPMVESCQFRLSEALNDCENRSIDEAECQIAIPIKQIPDAAIVLRREINDFKPAVLAVSQKGQKGVWRETLAGKPVQLNDDRRWDKHCFLSRL